MVTVTATQAGNGAIAAAQPVSQTLPVSPAPLTVSAHNASMAAGTALPSFSASFSGWVNGDTTATLGGAPALASTATASSPAGTYPITVARGSLSAANYALGFVNGTLSIVAVPPSGTATLTVASTLAKTAGAYQASITVRNTGTGAAANVLLTAANLGSAAESGLPMSLGTVAAGDSATVVLSFPLSAGADGATVLERIAGTYASGTFTGSLRVALP